jgi:hypothetical protein
LWRIPSHLTSKTLGAVDNQTMLWKLGITFALVMLILPHIPGPGMGAPTALLPVEIGRFQTALFDALDKVRADLKANKDFRR